MVLPLNGGFLICGKNVVKQKGTSLYYKMNCMSLKEVTLEGKWFGFPGDQWSFLCVTRWTLGYGLLGHRKHTWKGSSGSYTYDTAWRFAASRLCVVLASMTTQWGCQDRPMWCGWGHENSVAWHAGRWLQHFLGQRAWLNMRMCPMGLWMPSYNGVLSGFGFGYI